TTTTCVRRRSALTSQQRPDRRQHLRVNASVCRQRLIAENLEALAAEIAHRPPSLLDEQRPGGSIPRLQLPLPEAVDAPRGDPAEIEGGRSGATNAWRAEHQGLEKGQVEVGMLSSVVGETAREQRWGQCRCR